MDPVLMTREWSAHEINSKLPRRSFTISHLSRGKGPGCRAVALARNLRVLEQNGIRYAGGGENIIDAHRPVILNRNGTRIGFLVYACMVFPFQHAATEQVPGIASMRINTYYQPPKSLDKPGTPPKVTTVPDPGELERMQDDISRLKRQADIVIVSYHWGISHHTELLDYQIEVAHEAIDAGADVIMGHGNHELGALEVWKEKPVFYGLANFVFDWYKMRDRKDGLLVKVDVRARDLDRVSFVPLRRNNGNYPVLLDPNEGDGAQLFQIVKERSAGLSSLILEGMEINVELE